MEKIVTDISNPEVSQIKRRATQIQATVTDLKLQKECMLTVIMPQITFTPTDQEVFEDEEDDDDEEECTQTSVTKFLRSNQLALLIKDGFKDWVSYCTGFLAEKTQNTDTSE